MQSNFVVATVEDGKPSGFYTVNTASNLEMSEDLQRALTFVDKASARAAQAAYQSQFLDKEVVVLEATVQVKLA